MVYLSIRGRAMAAQDALGEVGVLTLAIDDDRMRFVLHKDLGDEDVERAIAALREALPDLVVGSGTVTGP